MQEYKGSVSGTGVSDTRQNEITADNVGLFRNWVVGNDSYGIGNGVLSNCHFEAEILTANEIRIGKGICLAYGYMGYNDRDITFTFQLPSVTQYWIVYGEIAKSVVPNTFIVKVKNNQGYADIGEYTMRQDQLSTIKTGIYQEPLYLLRVSADNGVEIIDPADYLDMRWRGMQILQKINNVHYSLNTSAIVTTNKDVKINIEDGVTIVGSVMIGDYPASTAYVDEQVQIEINK